MSSVTRALLIAAGSVCVALGVIGAFLPLLPTTPFMLLAAACFARSSPRMLRWLNENRWFGSLIRDYRAGLGIPLRQKVIAIAAIWLTIGLTIAFFIVLLWVRLLLAAIALAVTIHLLLIKTRRPPESTSF
jgi:uncharacterized membrane protein YbaN (DUF454 family)